MGVDPLDHIFIPETCLEIHNSRNNRIFNGPVGLKKVNGPTEINRKFW